jgi:PadR family transcriptional regulator, regulatory protein AphA
MSTVEGSVKNMSLRHALLGLLVERSASGYDLVKLFDTSLANVWPATRSQVYAELGRLAGCGLVDVAARGARGRKEYTLTPSGLAELRRWLAGPAREQPRRSDALLRVFFLGVLPREQARDYLAERAVLAAEYHARLRELEASLDWDEGMLSVNGRLALEYGLRLTAMDEEWARWARDQAAREIPPAPAAVPPPPPEAASPGAAQPSAG